jgi:hypothetical protein
LPSPIGIPVPVPVPPPPVLVPSDEINGQMTPYNSPGMLITELLKIFVKSATDAVDYIRTDITIKFSTPKANDYCFSRRVIFVYFLYCGSNVIHPSEEGRTHK